MNDGWLDLYEQAFPTLKAYQIPATVFLPTDFIGTERWFWTDLLAHLLIQRGHTKSSPSQTAPPRNNLVNKLEKVRGSHEPRLENSIEILKTLRDEKIEEILSELSSRWNLDPSPQRRTFLSWEEVREMSQTGLITFGSHTASHKILTTLNDEEIQDELIKSKEKLISENTVDPSFIPFCYPNGNFNDKIAGMVKKTGYSLAVSTKNGWNSTKSDSFTLRRIGIHQDMTSAPAMFGCRIVNLF